MVSAKSQPSHAGVARLLAGYRPLPGVSDELLDAQGNVRPVWRNFIDHLAGLTPEELARRVDIGDQYLRDAGVFFREYGDDEQSERSWPLSHVPVQIDANEWKAITEGLSQRADLLESIVSDLYGQQRLVQEGHLPASLVAMSPEWLRPLVGVRPRSGQFLHFIAFEIGRGPDGQWWVLGDRVQAPSGAGFALENRVATTRAFADLYAQSNVHRLAGFFRVFRDTMNDLRGDSESRVGILTPGRLNDTYFEHAYIARYLGFALLEGEDLTVENGQLMVRTIAGLEPVSVLWRRIDASFADPLELNEHSRLGAPGTVEAIRRGQLAMVNALGSGVLEMRALLAFMPRLAQALLDEPLKLPNIATWWCGQEAERAHVLANADRMMIGEALSTRMLFDSEDQTRLGAAINRDAVNVADLLARRGPMLVGQEAVTLSTAPVLSDGLLAPRPMSLRVFLARTPRGWRAMPGGYARIGRSRDAKAIAMQRGGSVADVWVVSDRPVRNETLLHPSTGSTPNRLRQGALPSRAADNLFWMGRYVERAEGLIRLLRAWHVRVAEAGREDSPLLAYATGYPGFFDSDPAKGVLADLHAAIAAATASATQVRDRFSVDGWTALNELAASARIELANIAPGYASARALGLLLRQISGFTGLVHENMYRFDGWRFLSIGRSLERASTMAALLAWFADETAPEGAFDMAIEVGDNVLTHRRLFAVASSRATVVDLLACDANNPRSIHYQLAELKEHAAVLPGSREPGQMSELSRAILRLHADVAVKTPDMLDTDALLTLHNDLGAVSDLLTKTYLR